MAGVAGRSGRRPKPAEKKLLAGNPGKRAINVEAPDFSEVTNIDCPEWIDGYGRDLWLTIAPQLCKERILQGTDIQNLEVYCNAYNQFRMAQKCIRDHGVTVEGAQGGMVKNPAATALKEAVSVMATYGGMLGLDPSSRQRLIGPKGKKQNNPFAALGI